MLLDRIDLSVLPEIGVDIGRLIKRQRFLLLLPTPV